MLTLRMSDSGATMGVVGDFKPDGSIGKFVSALKDAKPLSLQGLPNGNGGFLLAGAANWDPASIGKVLTAYGDALIGDETVAKDPRAAEFKQEIELQKKMLALTTGVSFVALDPPAGGKNGYFCGVALMNTNDPEGLKKAALEAAKHTALQQATNPDMVIKVTTVPNAVTIKDVKLTKLNYKVSLREETPDKPVNQAIKAVFPMIDRMYGPDGLTAYIGTVGGRLIVIYGSDQTTLESGIAAAQDNTDDLTNNQAISQVKDQVVPNPIAVGYLPVTRWVTLMQSILKPGSGGDPLSPAIAGAPPALTSVGINGSMMTAEVHVPITTISGVQEAVQRLQRAMMGGGMPAQQLP
jgi:hypothetical protein